MVVKRLCNATKVAALTQFTNIYRHYKSCIRNSPKQLTNNERNSLNTFITLTGNTVNRSLAPEATGSKASMEKSHKSSVVIIPPESCWDQIQAIRKIHDKSYVRWMPHINLVYPFIPDIDNGQNFADASQKIQATLSDIKPFQVCFTKDNFKYFMHRKNCTLWLKPEPGCEEIDPTAENNDEHCDVDPSIANDVDANIAQAAGDSIELNTDGAQAVESISNVTDGAQAVESISNVTDGAQAVESNVTDAKTESAQLCSNNKETEPMSKKQAKKAKRKLQKEQQMNEQRQQAGDDIGCLHPNILQLQSVIEAQFPGLKDVSEISERGFTPHLSLGQFPPNTVDAYKHQFSEEWADIEFGVNEVYFISRSDFNDPFHIQQTIQLGMK